MFKFLLIALISFSTTTNAGDVEVSTPKFSQNMPAELRMLMIEDFNFVRSIAGNGASELHRQVFGKVVGHDYIKFINQHVEEIAFDQDKNECDNDPSTVACADIDAPVKRIWVTKAYLGSHLEPIDRISLLLHEAKHLEKERWMHVPCLKEDKIDETGRRYGEPSLAGLEACDKEGLGSYGVQVIFLKNIENFCTSCNTKTKELAARLAEEYLTRLINPVTRTMVLRDLEL